MHSERYRISAADHASPSQGRRVLAVGTTSLRALESARAERQAGGRHRPLHLSRASSSAWCKRLLTNFHLPKSTLLMLVCGVRRHGAHPQGLCACDRRALPLLLLRRRDADRRNGHEVHACTHRDGAARRGALELAHGRVDTPAFMPVGTYGTVKAMSPEELRRARRADRPRQHLPPVAAARARGDRQARRPAPLHGLGRADPHRLGRLPGVQPRRRCARSPRRACSSLADQRRPAAPHARGVDAHPARARLRHRDGVRRMHSPTRRPSSRRRSRCGCRCAGRALEERL